MKTTMELSEQKSLLKEMPAVDRIIFSSDILKVDDRRRNRFRNPQNVNVNWISTLFAPLLEKHYPDLPVSSVYGDENLTTAPRARAYADLGLPLESASWAQIYEGQTAFEALSSLLNGVYDGSLVILYECPPYLLRYLNERQIPFIDFSIHPVRFLKDYLFGIRSNVASIQEKVQALQLPDESIRTAARVSRARTRRILPDDRYREGSAIFFGQIEIDSSIIYDGKVAGMYELKSALEMLASTHEEVFFKAHPHTGNLAEQRKLAESIRGCKSIEINAYDALGCDAFSTVGSLSSGTLHEARYFNKKGITRFLPSISPFDMETHPCPYVPVFHTPLFQEFWDHILNSGSDYIAPYTDNFLGDSPMKFMINMKWGR